MKKGYAYRALSTRAAAEGAPASWNEESRSVEVIAASEDPVMVWDWDRGVIEEVLLMSGYVMPANRQLPLCDTHARWSTYSVLGSARELRVEGGLLVGTVQFSSAPEAESPATKVREGHLTDFSIGYQVLEAVWIKDGETQVIDGRTFRGPLRVVTRWNGKELSICPIGADEKAKARSARHGQEVEHMDKHLRAFLVRRGLAEDASDEQVWEFYNKLNDNGEGSGQRQAPAGSGTGDGQGRQAGTGDGGAGEGGQQVDLSQQARQAVTEERQRVREIAAMGRSFGCEQLAEQLTDEGSTVEAARAAINAAYLERQRQADPQVNFRGSITIGVESRDKFRTAARSALLMLGGVREATPAAGAEELGGRSLVEMCRMALVQAGQRDTGNPMDMVGRALTTSDMPVILGETANLSLLEGWEAAGETWSQWCGDGTVTDFKIHKKARASELGDLDEIPELGEYKSDKPVETFEQYQVVTFGKLFGISRQAIINNNIGALIDDPRDMGETAARKLGDVAYATLIANGAMGDGIALFAADHGNLAETGGALGVTSLDTANAAMKLQKDIRGKRRLNIRPQFLLAPVALEGQHNVFFNSVRFVDGDEMGQRDNPYYKASLARVYEPRLDDDSATAWYLAGPRGKTVVMYFLNGVKQPYMEMRGGFYVDGVEWKVRIDAGAKAMDFRGLYKNAGE